MCSIAKRLFSMFCRSIFDIVKSFIVTAYFEFVGHRPTFYNSSTFTFIPKIRCISANVLSIS